MKMFLIIGVVAIALGFYLMKSNDVSFGDVKDYVPAWATSVFD